MTDITRAELIARIIDLRIRPVLQAHGGDISFVSFDEKTQVVLVTLQGACTTCPNALSTLKETVEGFLKLCVSDEITVRNQAE